VVLEQIRILSLSQTNGCCPAEIPDQADPMSRELKVKREKIV
jgi:hypothetical protein